MKILRKFKLVSSRSECLRSVKEKCFHDNESPEVGTKFLRHFHVPYEEIRLKSPLVQPRILLNFF